MCPLSGIYPGPCRVVGPLMKSIDVWTTESVFILYPYCFHGHINEICVILQNDKLPEWIYDIMNKAYFKSKRQISGIFCVIMKTSQIFLFFMYQENGKHYGLGDVVLLDLDNVEKGPSVANIFATWFEMR